MNIPKEIEKIISNQSKLIDEVSNLANNQKELTSEVMILRKELNKKKPSPKK